MGEQGAESVHAHVHKLEANYSGIMNRLDRLKYIFNEYMLETAPALLNLKPPVLKSEKPVKLCYPSSQASRVM